VSLLVSVSICYILAAAVVFGIPAAIHYGIVALRNHTGRDWSLLLLGILMMYLALVLITLCVGFYWMYSRFFGCT